MISAFISQFKTFLPALDFKIFLAIIVGGLLFLLSLATLLVTFGIRFSLLLREKRKKRVYKIWKPLMAQCLVSVPENLPRIKNSEAHDFMILWNHFQTVIKGEDHYKLIILARSVQLDRFAMQNLNSRYFQHQIMAILTLGNLEEKNAADELVKHTENQDPIFSLYAVRALMKINPTENLHFLMSHMINRSHWSFPMAASIIKETDSQIISVPLTEAIFEAPDEIKIKMIPLLKFAYSEDILPLIRHYLESINNPEVISSVLAIMQDPKSLDIARRYLYHDTWFVRLQAIKAIGRLGDFSDVNRLAPHLADKEWWVRYRTAESLSLLPKMTTEILQEIEKKQTDRYAKEIMTQIISERVKK